LEKWRLGKIRTGVSGYPFILQAVQRGVTWGLQGAYYIRFFKGLMPENR